MGPLVGAALQEEVFYLRQALRTLPVLFLLAECGCHVISQLRTPWPCLPCLEGRQTLPVWNWEPEQNSSPLCCFHQGFHYNNRNTKEANRHTQVSQESFIVEESETQRNMTGSGECTHEGKAPKLELWYSRTLTQKVMDVPAQTQGKFSSPLHLSYPAP